MTAVFRMSQFITACYTPYIINLTTPTVHHWPWRKQQATLKCQ